MKKSTKKKIWIRPIIQAFFLVLIALIAINHTLAEGGGGIPLFSSASLHAICPFGGVVTLHQFITTGTFVKKIHESSVILFGLSYILAILFGPVLCGWVCPLGTIQEWFSKIGKKFFKKKFNRFIPYKYDKYLRFLRYGVLGWVVYMTAISGNLVFSEIDPYYALFNFWSGEVAVGGLIVLGITLVTSLFIERPWCKYACPLGAILGVTNLFRVFKIRRMSSKCTLCKACDTACPMNIAVSEKEVIRDHQCISCMNCTSEMDCPIDETVEFSTSLVRSREVSKHEN